MKSLGAQTARQAWLHQVMSKQGLLKNILLYKFINFPWIRNLHLRYIEEEKIK